MGEEEVSPAAFAVNACYYLVRLLAFGPRGMQAFFQLLMRGPFNFALLFFFTLSSYLFVAPFVNVLALLLKGPKEKAYKIRERGDLRGLRCALDQLFDVCGYYILIFHKNEFQGRKIRWVSTT